MALSSRDGEKTEKAQEGRELRRHLADCLMRLSNYPKLMKWRNNLGREGNIAMSIRHLIALNYSMKPELNEPFIG